jgi:chemotaxis protein MotB
MAIEPIEEPIEEGDEFGTVYGDMITFVAVLFILLFTMVYNKQEDEVFFEQMRMKMGGPKIEQKQKTHESLFLSNVQNYIKDEKLSQYVLILVDEQKIRIVLNDQVLFKSGSADLLRGSGTVLRGFAEIIRKVKNPIVIEGHTDSQKVLPGTFKDNWELSLYRAYNVLRFLVDETGINEKKLSLKGVGSQLPLYSNDTPQNRQKNRRVEINIIRVKKAEVAP